MLNLNVEEIPKEQMMGTLNRTSRHSQNTLPQQSHNSNAQKHVLDIRKSAGGTSGNRPPSMILRQSGAALVAPQPS